MKLLLNYYCDINTLIFNRLSLCIFVILRHNYLRVCLKINVADRAKSGQDMQSKGNFINKHALKFIIKQALNMEKRIKVLYIFTIIAILAFLGMQVYWLYGRYEFSLNEYETNSYKTIVQLMSTLNQNRPDLPDEKGRVSTRRSTYNFNKDVDSVGRAKKTATVISYKYYAHELLGIKDKRPLTEEEKERVAKMVLEDAARMETKRVSYDASNAPSDGAIWSAFKNVDAELESPLKAETVDSTLSEEGMDVNVSLIVTDSMVWEPSMMRHATAFDPSIVVSVPYSELEKKSVVIECHLPVAKIFNDMQGSLIVVALLSLFLIICLLLQFNTILKLSRLDKMRNSFTTTMIHELKRPISTLKMCVSGIENDKMMANPEVKAELVAETRNALDNLSSYFSKLRDITFNNVEQIPLNITQFSLYELVESVELNTSIPGGKEVVFDNEVDASVSISADRVHLANILGNLFENAVKYSGEKVGISVSSSYDASDNLLQIKVSDNGNGIPATDLRHIFTRFYRGRASVSEVPGMGLGLTYVKLLTEAHGGHIEVQSREGQGTIFTIILPQ